MLVSSKRCNIFSKFFQDLGVFLQVTHDKRVRFLFLGFPGAVEYSDTYAKDTYLFAIGAVFINPPPAG